jgi:hypothetical protein
MRLGVPRGHAKLRGSFPWQPSPEGNDDQIVVQLPRGEGVTSQIAGVEIDEHATSVVVRVIVEMRLVGPRPSVFRSTERRLKVPGDLKGRRLTAAPVDERFETWAPIDGE